MGCSRKRALFGPAGLTSVATSMNNSAEGSTDPACSSALARSLLRVSHVESGAEFLAIVSLGVRLSMSTAQLRTYPCCSSSYLHSLIRIGRGS